MTKMGGKECRMAGVSKTAIKSYKRKFKKILDERGEGKGEKEKTRFSSAILSQLKRADLPGKWSPEA